MGHDHSHDHSNKNLKIAFFLNLGFTILEIFGGIYTNSIAIMSDAVHDLGDSLAIGTSWFLEVKSKKTANKHYSFGYNRLSLLGAVINALVLIIGSSFVIYNAINRIITPEPSDANGMLLFALFGILINGYAAWKLSNSKTMNEKVISWHLIEDVLGWVAVLIVSIILKFKDIQYLDPLLSMFITLYILWNVGSRLKESVFLFLQGTPLDINQEEIETKLLAIDKIASLHNLHIWSLDGEQHVFTVHICLKDIATNKDIIEVKQVIKLILENYHFKHITIETELEGEPCLVT